MGKKSPDIKKIKAVSKQKPTKETKAKLSSQSSVNDDADSSSTTTESSNAEELTETFSKGINNTPTIVTDNSTANEQTKKKKKVAAKPKVEDIPVKENIPNPNKK